MLLEEIMKNEVHTLNPQHTVQDVFDLFEKERIRHAPVLHDGKVVGIVTDRDLKDALPSRFTVSPKGVPYHKTVEEIMTRNPVTAHPINTISMFSACLSIRIERKRKTKFSYSVSKR